MLAVMVTRWRNHAPLYEQLADLIREEIASGRLRPGTRLPSERLIASEHGTGRDTVRDALSVLRREGLITMRPGMRTVVRAASEHRPIALEPGDEAIARMPSPEERRQLNIDEGIPVIEIRGADRVVEVLPASEVALQAS
jgi:DNA-binding FadR family transcriptional regulator